VELVHIRTEGDVLTGSLSQMGGTGVFVAALRDALLRDVCDVAVHSLKDLPT
jgi:hydroxymethylbilane synthase